MSRQFSAFMIAALSQAWLSCGQAAGNSGRLAVVVQAQTSNGQITRVSVVVSPAGVAADLLLGTGGTFSGTLTVGVGSQTVAATAWAGLAQVGTGSGSAVVTKGQQAQLSITVLDTTGPAPVPAHSPVLTSLSVPATTAVIGDQLSLSATAFDADNDPIGFSWGAAPTGCGSFSPANAASTTWTAVSPGTCTVSATATAKGKSDSRSASIAVSAGFAISGTITPPATGSGASVALSGAKSATTAVDGSGNYLFSALANGSYAVTPSKAGFGFTPASAAVIVGGADRSGVNFVIGSPVTVSISPTSAWLMTGGTQQFAASVTGTTNTAVTWSPGGGGSVSATGLYTAPATAGNVTVTATSVADPTKSASASVSVTPAVTDDVLFGDQRVELQVDSAPVGQAVAFQATAKTSGNLKSLVVYLDASSTVSRLVGGLYADAGGHPGALLTVGSNAQPFSGAWNTISLPATSLITGTQYWVAILGTSSGTLVYRDARGSCAGEINSQAALTSLPASWTTGTPLAVCPVSIFGVNSTVVFFDDFAGTALSAFWNVISRHGEYSQNETECIDPRQVAVANGLTISTAAQNSICGDFNPDGTPWHAPSSWPYVTGDIQWANLNFTYGAIEIRAKFPDQRTSLWPATWLLDSRCQATNPLTGESGVGPCPPLGGGGYTEIDMTECYGTGWCQFHVANPGFGIGNGCDANYVVDTNWHTFKTVWTSSGITQYMDGVVETTCAQALVNPMFLLIQTQTGGVGGTPDNAFLPATLMVDYVKVTQP